MFTAGFVQFSPVRRDVGRNISAVEGLLAGVRADLLVLPELANSGYLYASPADLAPYAEAASGCGPFLSALKALAARTGALLVAGFAERGAEGLYNSAAAVDASGVRQVYRKVHLFAGENDLFLPGNGGFKIVNQAGARVGMMICFDWIFPESARTLALGGAQIIAHPSNLVLPWCQSAMVTRSLENGVFTITANRAGAETLDDQTLAFTGGSQVVDNHGRCLCRAPAEGECVLIASFEPREADDKAVGQRNNLFLNRRPEMYGR